MNRLNDEKKAQLGEIIRYLVFGGLTTLVNLIVYFAMTEIMHVNYGISNTIAWILSVLFAYLTNKYFVFKTKENHSIQQLTKELTSFFGVRLFSYGLDMLVLFLSLSVIHLVPFWAKLWSQIVVVIVNYIFSKWFVFKSEE